MARKGGMFNKLFSAVRSVAEEFSEAVRGCRPRLSLSHTHTLISSLIFLSSLSLCVSLSVCSWWPPRGRPKKT